MDYRQQMIPEGGAEEPAFQNWYKQWAERTGISPDPDEPEHRYDYRAAYRNNAQPTVDASDGMYHWPSAHKHADHPNRYVPMPGGGILDTLLDKPL